MEIWVLFCAVVLAFCSGIAVAAVENLEVSCKSDGSYEISLSGNSWFRSGPLDIRNNGKLWSTNQHTLKLTDYRTAEGKDIFGGFTSNVYRWQTVGSNGSNSSSLDVRTHINVYSDLPIVVFGISYPSGAKNTSMGNLTNGTISSWPSFVIEEKPVERGYLTWSGNMAAVVKIGRWSPTTGIYGDVDGGFPLVVFDSKMENTVVLAPLIDFFIANQISFTDSITGERVLTFGPISSVEEVPPDYDFWTVLVAGQNVTGTMQRFGHVLRTMHGKDDSYRRSDFTINYLGYWTDNGACYHYNDGGFANYEELLVAVKEDADKQEIPYRYLQIDSWWYFKGSDGGVKNWTAQPDVFPNGINAVVNRTGWPIVAHNRWWSPQTDYAKQNGGDYDFIIDAEGALPLDADFWDFLLSSSQRKWDLWVYEQDWLYKTVARVNQLLTDVSLGRHWLKQMGNAAQQYGLTIQYCMAWPRHLLSSVEIPVVTQTRVSEDYSPGNEQWRIGITTILAHSLGLAAFKDTFHTEVTEEGCPNKQNEPSPALETYAAALSGGPVGPGDHIGMANKMLIMGTCMTDGRLLKPTRPAMSLDSTFLQRALGSGGPDGELWVAYTEVKWLTWYHVIAAALNGDYALAAAELPPSRFSFPGTSFPTSVAFQHTLDGKVTTVLDFTASSKLMISKCGETDFQYWTIAPVLDNGWALLGELNKILTISETRFPDIEVRDPSDQQYLVVLQGVAGEIVPVTLYNPKEKKTVTVSCTVGPAGTAVLLIPDLKCTDNN